MKILISIGFILCCVLYLFIAIRLINLVLTSIKNRNLNFVVTALFSLLILFIFFIEFWLLTGIFPLKTVMMLIPALVLSQLIYLVVGSLMGITIEDTKNKIQVLTVVRGFEFGLKYPWIQKINAILGISMFLAWIIVLIIYWTTSSATPSSLFWISFLVFIIPQSLGLVIIYQQLISALSSINYDNDLRNHYIVNGFNEVIVTTIFILLPLSLFYEFKPSFASVLPFWIMVLIPLCIFVSISIVPYMIGANKFYYQRLHNLDWRIEWLDSVHNSLAIAGKENREKSLHEKLRQLDNKIEELINEHEVLKYVDDSGSEESEYLATNNKTLKTIIDLFKINKGKIHDWDIRANYLKKLQDLKENINIDNYKDCISFVEINLKTVEKEKEKLSKPKNRAGAILLTLTTSAATALIGLLLKHYEIDILRILNIN